MTTTAAKRNITSEDILLHARLRGGARITVNDPPPRGLPTTDSLTRMVLDGCDMVLQLDWYSYENSPLEIIVDGRDITILEKGETVATAKLEPKAAWREKRLANGWSVDDVIMCTNDVQSNIIISPGCQISTA